MRPVHAIAGLCLASLAVGFSVLALGWPGSDPPDDPEEHLALLIETLGEYRPLEARLVGFDHWAPCETPDVGPIQPDTLLPEDVLPRTVCSPLPEAGTAEFEALWNLAPPSGAPESVALLRLQAVWDLVWRTQGDSGKAVQKLERAVELRDDGGAVWSDLAAAYLARAEDEDSPLDIIRAMDAAQRALDASPELPEALFNRALAFERFFQRESARQAWDDFLAVEPGSPYAHEARERLGPLSEPTLYEAWHGGGREELERAVLAGDEGRVDVLVERFAYFAREWVEEEILPAWGAAELEGDLERARNARTVARAVGKVLAEDDQMVADSVAVIDQTTGSTRLALARGQGALGVGFAAYRRHDLDVATVAFENAERDLKTAGSPQAYWAVYHQFVQLYYQSAIESSVAFKSFQDQIPPTGYPLLRGRIEWMLGLAAVTQGRPISAAEHYRVGIKAFDRLDNPDSGMLRSYLASSGSAAVDWQYRLQAFSDLREAGVPRRLYNALHGVISQLETVDPVLARPLTASFIATGDAWEVGPASDARLTTARLHRETGEIERAFEFLAEAEALAVELPATDLRERLLADLELAQGQTLATANRLEEASATLSRALDRYAGSKHTLRVATLLEARAGVLEETGDLERARSDFEQAGILLIDQFTENFHDHGRLPQPAAEAMLDRLGHRLATLIRRTEGNTSVASLATLDRTRAPWRPTTGVLPQDTHAIADQVPKGRLVVVTATSGDRIGLWLLSRSAGLAFVESSLEEGALHAVGTVRGSVHGEGATEESFQRATAPLYDVLIRPALNHDPSATELVLVPDGPLWALPYLGLYDAASGRYLTEQFPISLATSLYAALAPPPDPQAPLPGLLAISGDGFDQTVFGDLDSLPQTAQETHRIAGLYSNSIALSGTDATRAKIIGEHSKHRPGIVHVAGHFVDGDRPGLLIHAPRRKIATRSDQTLDLALLRTTEPELLFISTCRAGKVETLSRILTSTGFPAGVGNLWDTEDAVAARMGVEFHRRYMMTREASRALQQVVSELRSASPGPSQVSQWAGWVIIHTNRSVLNSHER